VSASEIIATLYRKHGPLTIAEAQGYTGLHPARIRGHVKSPTYCPVSCEWATRRWEWKWAIVTEVCDCGQPAWYRGRAMMLFSNVLREEKFLLCDDCVRLVDAKMRVERIHYGK
jgi:hypothetical protein